MPTDHDLIDVARGIVRAWDEQPALKIQPAFQDLAIAIERARQIVGGGVFGGGSGPGPETDRLRQIAAPNDFHAGGGAADLNPYRGGSGGSGKTYYG